VITESVGRDSYNGARGFRTVLFDINGQTVYRPSLEELEPTSTKAQKTFYAWYESFNAENYYNDQLKHEVIKNYRKSIRLSECLNALNEEITA
jgi:hypothetical protein